MSIFRNRGADTEVILHLNYDKNIVEFFITKLQLGFDSGIDGGRESLEAWRHQRWQRVATSVLSRINL